jgi:hypothetical protein
MDTTAEYAQRAQAFWVAAATTANGSDHQRYNLDSALIHAQLAVAASALEAAGRHPRRSRPPQGAQESKQ